MNNALLRALGPEFIIGGFGLILALLDRSISLNRKAFHLIGLISVVFAFGVALSRISNPTIIMSGFYIDSPFTLFFKLITLILLMSLQEEILIQIIILVVQTIIPLKEVLLIFVLGKE